MALTACLVDLPPAFSSFSFFSCFSYCFSSSFCFCWYIFLKVTVDEARPQSPPWGGRPAGAALRLAPLTVVAPVVVQPLGVQVDDVCAHVVQEALVMGDDQQRLPPALQVAG